MIVSQFPLLPSAIKILVAGRAVAPLSICLANVRDQYEILECHLDSKTREGRLCVAACFDNEPQTHPFKWNGKPFGDGSLALSQLHGVITMGSFAGLLTFTINGTCKASAMTPQRLPVDEEYFCAIIATGGAPPDIRVIPCWSVD